MSKTKIKPENKEEFEEIKNVPYPLPEGWKWVRLSDVLDKKAKFNLGKVKNKDYLTLGKYPIIDQGEKFIAGYFNKENLLYNGKLPVIIIGDHTLKVKYVDFPFIQGGDGLKILIPQDTIVYPKYLYFMIVFAKPKVKTYSRHWKIIKNLLIPIPIKNGKPDLEKQKQIVERVETIFKEIDKAIALRQKALEDTKKLFENVLNKIFKEAEKDKKNWEWVVISEIIKTLETGKRPKGGAVKTGIPSIGGEHLNNYGGFNFNNLKFIPKDFYEKMKKGKIQKTDILIVKDGATTGKISFVREDFPFKNAAVNEHVFILRVVDNISPKYVFWILYSPLGQQEILKNFGGAAQGGINRGFINNVKIPIPMRNKQPDFEKQKQIAELLDNLHSKIKQLEELQQIQIEKFKQLKESILSKAFRGELV